jgi:hypothetical protein
MKNHFCFTVVSILFASGLCLGQTDSGNNSPSLGDLARQQHHAKKTEKVFTDEDLPSRSAGDTRNVEASSQSQGRAPAASAGNTATGPDTAEKSGKPSTSNSAAKKEDAGAELKKKLDHYTSERDAWQQAAKRYEDLLANEKDEFRRQGYEDALSKDRHNAELYQAKIDEMQGSQNKDQSPDASAGSGGHK